MPFLVHLKKCNLPADQHVSDFERNLCLLCACFLLSKGRLNDNFDFSHVHVRFGSLCISILSICEQEMSLKTDMCEFASLYKSSKTNVQKI